jgi:micrococcal nuclease
LAVLVISVSGIAAFTIFASAEDGLIPSWIKNTASFWVKGDVSDSEFISAVEWMLENKVIKLDSMAESREDSEELRSIIIKLEDENRMLREENVALYDELVYYDSVYGADTSDYYEPTPTQEYSYVPEPRAEDYCYGSAGCFFGLITSIVDGDTVEVDGKSIRLALVNTPEYGEVGYTQARSYIEKVCPVGSSVLVDEDDGQTQGSYGRMIARVYCGDTSLNEAIVKTGLGIIETNFCSTSEFSSASWAQSYGCSTSYQEVKTPKSTTQPSQPKTQPSQTTQPRCDPSYPDFCIPPPPPDLDCGDISQKRFTVLQPDPHRFDGDKDGIGCES